MSEIGNKNKWVKPLTRGSKPKVVKVENTKDSIKHKLVKPKINPTSHKYYKDDKFISQFDTNDFSSITADIKRKAKDVEEIKSQFPDIKLALEVLVSSIISPNSMMGTPITYNADTFKITTTTINRMLTLLRDRLHNKYELDTNLYNFIMKAFAVNGAYCELLISETQLDNMVNSDLKKDTTSLESLLSTSDINREIMPNTILGNALSAHISITDDISVINTAKRFIDSRIEDVSLESMSLKEKLDRLYRERKYEKYEKYEELPELARETYGAALRMGLPTEAVIPIYFNGEVDRHIRYVVLLDEQGIPIREEQVETTDIMQISSTIVDKARQARVRANTKSPEYRDMNHISESFIEKELAEYLVGDSLSKIADTDALNHIYTIIARRALDDKRTRILIVKPSNMLYFAMDYRTNGTGKTLLEDLKQISSMRALLRLARANAIIKDSIPNVEIEVDLDNDDGDPYKTMEMIKGYVSKTRELSMPVGIINHNDLSDWLHKAGYRFKFNHESLPDLRINYNQETHSPTIPDDDISEKLEDSIYQHIGVNRNMIDDTKDADYAATVISRNIIFARRISMRQILPNKHLTHYGRMVIDNDGVLREELLEVLKTELKENKKLFLKDNDLSGVSDKEFMDYLLDEFKEVLRISLPKVKSFEEDGTKEAFLSYKEELEETIEAFFSEESLPEDLVGKIGDKIEDFKTMMMHTKIREWMANNNYMPDLLDIFRKDHNGDMTSKTVNDYNAYYEDVAEAMDVFVKNTKKTKKKADKVADKIEGIEEEEEVVDDGGTNEANTSEIDDAF